MCSEASLRAYPGPAGTAQQMNTTSRLNEAIAPTPIDRIKPEEDVAVPLAPVDPFDGFNPSDDPFAPVGRGRNPVDDLMPLMY